MRITRRRWFDLARHDGAGEPSQDPPPATDPPADPPATGGDDPPNGDPNDPGDGDGDPPGDPKPKPAEPDWKTRARDWEKRAKANAEKAKKYDELEAAKKTETERLTARATKAELAAQQATARAVRAEIRARAVETFADPTDAEGALEAAAYVGEDGEIDTDALDAALADLLERKPHWAKPKKAAPPPPPPAPKPDPSQGPRPGPGKTDYRTADRATTEQKMAQYGLRMKTPATRGRDSA